MFQYRWQAFREKKFNLIFNVIFKKVEQWKIRETDEII